MPEEEEVDLGTVIPEMDVNSIGETYDLVEKSYTSDHFTKKKYEVEGSTSYPEVNYKE